MRNYKILTNNCLTKSFNYLFNKLEVTDNSNGQLYLVKNNKATICYDSYDSFFMVVNIGCSKMLKEAFVFEFDDILWYKQELIYEKL